MPLRVNDAIQASPLRVIDVDRTLVVLSREEALALAKRRGLALVEINPKASPPTCRIMAWPPSGPRRPPPAAAVAREARYDTVRFYVGDQFIGEDDKGVLIVDLDGAKGLS